MADEEANVICGMVYDNSAGDDIRVTVVATGLNQGQGCVMHAVPGTAAAPVPNGVQPLLPMRGQDVESGRVASRRTGTDDSEGYEPIFSGGNSVDPSNLDLPAFLRRQAD